MIWITMTWIKHHDKANVSAAAPEGPQELLNAWVWFRWRFGARLWSCSALTVTQMGTHTYCKFYPWGGERRGEVTGPMSHTGGWLSLALDTQETNTSHSQPTSVSCRRRCTRAVSQHPALGVHAALREVPGGAERGKTQMKPPFWLHRDPRGVTCPEITGLCALVVQEEKQTETQVVRILIFGIVAVEVLVALFLVLLKKLHRHKLKTIFDFKRT